MDGTVVTGGFAFGERLRPHLPLAALLAATAVLYLWGLSRLGYANDFYAAAVKSGTVSWKAFFYGSFDSASFITVDKPPASLWLMELSGRIFGFSSFSMLLPQALEGVAAVALVYATVKRWFSTPAALLAGAALAVTPVAALMFRYNNPDALLVLLLVVSAYATTRALERASTLWLALAGAAIGFGFLTKMMQAFLVVPALAIVYLVAAPTRLRTRVWQVLVAGGALVVSAGWWVAIVELFPGPYIGGSSNGSILNLIWDYNGINRIEGTTGGPGGGFSGSPGISRLFNDVMGTQIAWLLPAAAVVLVAGLIATARAPRTDRSRAALLLWGGWLVITAGVFSFMSGIIHPYYTSALAPAVAVLAGVGSVELWRQRRRLVARILLASMLLLTSITAFELLNRTASWHPGLREAVLTLGVMSAIAVLGVQLLSRPLVAAVAAAALFAGLAAPLGYTLSTVSSTQGGAVVSAGPTGGSGVGGEQQSTSSALTSLLEQHASSYTWVAATSSSMTAAPLELATGDAVMSTGGFNGSDNAISLARFKALVAAHKIHYYLAGGGGFGGGPGGGNNEIESWVTSTFNATTVGGQTVYDLSAR